MCLPRGRYFFVKGWNFRRVSRVLRRVNIAERTGIRPSVWALVALVVGLAGVVLYLGIDSDPLGTASREEEVERERSADGSHHRGRRRLSLSSGPRSGSGYQRHDWSQESELSRRTALGLPLASFWREPPQAQLETDPQLAAMYRAFSSMRDPEADAPPLPFEPTAHRAELIDAEGELSMSPTSCDVRVLPVATWEFNCVVRVTCDGAVIYPHAGQDAGYVPCELENGVPVRALDDRFSDADGDPLVDLDLTRGTVTVEERGPDGERRYRATLRIHS